MLTPPRINAGPLSADAAAAINAFMAEVARQANLSVAPPLLLSDGATGRTLAVNVDPVYAILVTDAQPLSCAGDQSNLPIATPCGSAPQTVIATLTSNDPCLSGFTITLYYQGSQTWCGTSPLVCGSYNTNLTMQLQCTNGSWSLTWTCLASATCGNLTGAGAWPITGTSANPWQIQGGTVAGVCGSLLSSTVLLTAATVQQTSAPSQCPTYHDSILQRWDDPTCAWLDVSHVYMMAMNGEQLQNRRYKGLLAGWHNGPLGGRALYTSERTGGGNVIRYVSNVCLVNPTNLPISIVAEYKDTFIGTDTDVCDVFCVTNPTNCCGGIGSGSGQTGVQTNCCQNPVPRVLYAVTQSADPCINGVEVVLGYQGKISLNGGAPEDVWYGLTQTNCNPGQAGGGCNPATGTFPCYLQVWLVCTGTIWGLQKACSHTVFAVNSPPPLLVRPGTVTCNPIQIVFNGVQGDACSSSTMNIVVTQ